MLRIACVARRSMSLRASCNLWWLLGAVLANLAASTVSVALIMIWRGFNQAGIIRNNVVRNFYASTLLYAKKKGKSSSNDDEGAPVNLPDPKVYDQLMLKRLSALKDELSQIRGGSASKEMLNSINVTAYGSKIPLEEAGQITLKTPTVLAIAVFDTALTSFVVTALKESGMNLNPVVEGSNVLINVPKPSKEQRELQVKLMAKVIEKSKQDIRQIRKDGLDSLKKLKGKVSEDDTRRLTKQVILVLVPRTSVHVSLCRLILWPSRMLIKRPSCRRTRRRNS